MVCNSNTTMYSVEKKDWLGPGTGVGFFTEYSVLRASEPIIPVALGECIQLGT